MQPIELIHLPQGDHHPYEIRSYQRNPVFPFPDDQVNIGVLTRPIGAIKDLTIRYWIDDQPGQILESSFDHKGQLDTEGNIDDEGHLSEAAARAGLITGVDAWEVNLPACSSGQKISYQVSAFDSKKEILTDVYTYTVRKEINLEKVNNLYLIDRTLIIELCDLDRNQFCQLIIDLQKDDKFSVNVEFGPFGKVDDPKLQTLDFSQVGGRKIELDGGRFTISDSGTLLRCSLLHSEPLSLLHPVKLILGEGDQPEEIIFNFNCPPGESFYGFGERFNGLNQRGNRLDTRVFEQYKNQDQKTYLPVPLLLSSHGYGVFSYSSLNTIFNLAQTQASDWIMTSEVNGNTSLKIDFLLGDPAQPLNLISRLSALTGFPELPPHWAFGLWISSNEWNSQSRVEDVVNKHKKHDIPFSVLVLEAWSDENTFYIWNDATYTPRPGEETFSLTDFKYPKDGKWPDPKGMIDKLHERDHRLLLWQNPILKANTDDHRQLGYDSQTMLDNNYCVRLENDQPYRIRPFWFHDGLLMDFTHTAGRQWWLSKREYLFRDLGIDGFKTDGGEHIWGKDLVFADGQTSAEGWNDYPNQYVGAYYRFTKKQKSDGIIFSRAGFSGAQAFPCHWAGDENSTWEAFRGSILAGLNAGISGIPFWGWDIAGFSGEIPTAELYLRATAMSVFCPIMQYHSEYNDHKIPLNDRTPWNIAERRNSPEVLSIFRYFANLRMNLLPYIISAARQSSLNGIPMMRALCLVYPNDQGAASNPYHYLFGDHLLISPVIEPDPVSLEVYLPEGGWFSLWDDSYHLGGKTHDFPKTLDQIPAFVREDSVIPLNLGENYQLGSDVGNQTDSFQNLCFKLYPQSNGDYSWSEDNTSPLIDLSWKKMADDNFSLKVTLLDKPACLLLPSGYSFVGDMPEKTAGINNRIVLDPVKNLQLQVQRTS